MMFAEHAAKKQRKINKRAMFEANLFSALNKYDNKYEKRNFKFELSYQFRVSDQGHNLLCKTFIRSCKNHI